MGLVFSLLSCGVLATIFLFAAQGKSDTLDASTLAERWLSALVAPDGTTATGEPTWASLSVRNLAHFVEFGALGLTIGLAVPLVRGRATPGTWLTSVLICLCASVGDEVYKHFVPGRHFSIQDLARDAASYLVFTTVAHLVATRLTKGGATVASPRRRVRRPRH